MPSHANGRPFRKATLSVLAAALLLGSLRAPLVAQTVSPDRAPQNAAEGKGSTQLPPEIPLEPHAFEAPIPPQDPADTSMTAGEKFRYAIKNGAGPAAIGSALLWSGYSQYLNHDEGFGQGADGYFSRFGSKYGAGVTRQLTGSFALAALLHQDPRYHSYASMHRSASALAPTPSARPAGIWRRLGYAISREAITRGDDRSSQFNASKIGSAFGTAFIVNSWRQPPDRGVRASFEQAGMWIVTDTVMNVVKEFWPDVKRKLRR